MYVNLKLLTQQSVYHPRPIKKGLRTDQTDSVQLVYTWVLGILPSVMRYRVGSGW